ncbi:hypothetical protein [Nocardioides campestrisoli]|uniref:hypothetical protein n=1 Tax=Nocardioides campestrisoli TaxID=2736757 RepID=UPI0015E7C1B9|nr:hypothetical protein [Nocardioides campestrisoli]
MYFDHQPCRVCGAEVRVREHTRTVRNEPDSTVDDRVCTNPDCPTRRSDREDAPSA